LLSDVFCSQSFEISRRNLEWRFNVHISPALIFGSQVMAHVPLSLQRTHGKAFIYNNNHHRSLVLRDLIPPAVNAIAPLPPTFEPDVSDSYVFIPESEVSDSSRRFYGKIGMEFVLE
jgi:hypothetical protein